MRPPADSSVCIVSTEPPDPKHPSTKMPDNNEAQYHEAPAQYNNKGEAVDANGNPLPIKLVAAADMYASEPKPATAAGGIITVVALMAAAAYTVFQLVTYSRLPPVLTSYVQWSDTQGPFPAAIRCSAPGGCWVSNRHNDRWSSHGDEVEAAQQGCLVLKQGQQYTMNITYTQNVLNGLVIVWDPSAWEAGTTPGSGVQMLAETNYPAAPSGVFVLATPALGGTYLASYVETHNNSASVAKLRREWFITYVSADKSIVPTATACAGQLTPQQLANYTQATIRMQSAWYYVTVEPPDLLLTLVGNCGGALQLCLQAGAILLLTYEFLSHTLPRVINVIRRKKSNQVHQADNQISDQLRDAPKSTSMSPLQGQGPPGYVVTPKVYVDENTGRRFALLSPAGEPQEASSPGSTPIRGLALVSMSGDGAVATALKGLPVGGHMTGKGGAANRSAPSGGSFLPEAQLGGLHFTTVGPSRRD